MDPGPSIAGIGLCLLILALTSAVDAAFTSVSWRRLHTILADQAAHSRMLKQLTNDPYHFKATVILLNTSATIGAAALTLNLMYGQAPWLQAIALLFLLLMIMVVSAALPKALAVRDPQAVVRALSGPVSMLAFLFWPLVAVVNLLTRPLPYLTGTPSMTRTPLVIEEELRLLVNAGTEEGLLEHDEREMIEGIFSFNNTLVREVMVPRVDIVALGATTSLEEALETVIREGHSRIPIYQETIDTIVGILYAKDLLPALRDEQRDIPIRQLVRPAYFVPETIKVDALLREMQQSKIHMAVIVDEYGSTTGLATIEDLIEEIVGEIQDEYDTDEEPPIQIISDTEVIVDALLSLDEVNTLTGLSLASTDVDRIGGLVHEQLGRMPAVGDEVVVENGVITVLSLRGMRPEKLRITLRQRQPALDTVSPQQAETGHLATYPLNSEPLAYFFMRQTQNQNGVTAHANGIDRTAELYSAHYSSNSRA